MADVCTIRIEVEPDYERGCLGYSIEDVVKNSWGYLVPWFTARHGVHSGEIVLNDGEARVSWHYEAAHEETSA